MDGARSMQGSKKGFAAFVLGKNPNVKVVYCLIHREALMSKCLPMALKAVMDDVINVVSFIKSSGLRSRIFANLCESMEADFSCLLYHTEVRWLSKGKVLARMIALRQEILMFFESQQKSFEFLNSE